MMRRTRRILVALVLVTAFAVLAVELRDGYDATLVLGDLVGIDLPLPDLRGGFLHRDIEFQVGGQAEAADLYLPLDSAPRAGLVLVPGAAPEGRKDSRLVAFATTLARSGFSVIVPDVPSLRELRPSAGSTRHIGAAFQWLHEHGDLAPGSRAGIGAFSVAVGPAVLTALDPAVNGHVRFLLLVGGYYDLVRTLTYLTTGWFEAAGERHYREPNAYGRWVYALTNAQRLEDPEDQAALTALAHRKLDDPGAPVGDLLAKLSRQGRSVYEFITNTDPGRVAALIQQLPPAVRSDIEALDLASHDLASLKARFILVHGLDDDIIPYTESVALARSLPRGQAQLYLLKGLRHVDTGVRGLPDAWRMWRALQAVLAQRH